ncbi:MAG: 16S rRNA (cytidine(1402)-2'-O)-methyltransferase [Deltaproteobacteria bacterium]|nr:16S rRNA (cytidine(1402)-2'-O)-methyltransferase [Candidatus Anaeroferrophillus wilburensis]MBN2889778.1 16S rRNA (cytidine(1402)-2'-O)-methyltransferase [Deltaproteobacteria bacterium]
MAAPPGTLYIIPTPIGNLGDLTLRALEVLKEVDLVAAEDTRTARKLFSRFAISTPLLSFHDHSPDHRIERLLQDLLDGLSIGLISEAGTPGISDPGYPLIRKVIDAGLPLVSLPGACAAITALAGSGLPLHEYYFVGFLPVRKAARENRLLALRQIPATLVFYESPRRLPATLAALEKVFGNRRICIGRELTKIHEEYLRGHLRELIAANEDRHWRGEITLMVEGATEKADAPADVGMVGERLRQLQDEGVLSVRDMVNQLAEEFPEWRRKDIYALVLQTG